MDGNAGCRDGPAAGAWSAILSLGSACAVAYHLHRKGLVTRTGPFDWFGARDPDFVARMLRSRFAGFMDRATLSVMGEHNGYWKVGDAANAVFTLHDFPIVGRRPKSIRRLSAAERLARLGDRFAEPAWRWLPWLRFPGPGGTKIPLPGYPEFRRRVRRRVGRFLVEALKPGPVMFIRRARRENDAEVILAGLRELRGDRPTTLLVIGDGDEYGRDWGVPGLRTAIVPPEDPAQEEGWRGCDRDWDRIFEGCNVIDEQSPEHRGSARPRWGGWRHSDRKSLSLI
jgi:hypothetical protein